MISKALILILDIQPFQGCAAPKQRFGVQKTTNALPSFENRASGFPRKRRIIDAAKSGRA